MNEHSDSELYGQAIHLAAQLDALVKTLRKGEEWGGLGDLERITWAANDSAEFAYDGIFVSIGIWNLSAGTVNVAFTPNGARSATQALFTLSTRAFIILPYRGTTVSVGGAGAGSALITPFDVPQPANGGTF